MAINHFQPTVYHTAIGSHEPVLHIESGDTVITTTVDAWGQNAADKRVAPMATLRQTRFTSPIRSRVILSPFILTRLRPIGRFDER